MATKSIISAERLREILHYDPDTGIFRWRISPTPRVKIGQIAGHTQRMRPGYSRRRIVLGTRDYKSSQLAWLYMTGEFPPLKVDHINTDPMDNRWINLRLATTAQNGWNVGLRPNNTTGLIGVGYDKQRKKWRASVHIYLGRFDTPEAAHEAYKKAIIALRGTEFIHHSLR